MSTQATKSTKPAHASGEAKPKRQHFDIVLVGEGNSSLRIRARESNGGGARSTVIYTLTFEKDGKRVNRSETGGSETHATFEAAKAHCEKLAAESVKGGWLAKQRKAGGARRDAFDAKAIPGPKPSKELIARLTPKS